MACVKCGEVCSCVVEPPPSEMANCDPAPTAETGLEAEEPNPVAGETATSAWREELAARLHRYRARRKSLPPRYPSLRLPFDAADPPVRTNPVAGNSSAPVFEPASNHALALDPLPHQPPAAESKSEAPEKSEAVRQPAAHNGAKIIEFPRFAWGPPPPPLDQLAGPVMDRPRILEVPEVAPPLPALGGITIEPAPVREPEKRPGIDMPLQSAPLGRRLGSGVVDGLIIVAATALFGYIFWKVAAVRPPQLQILGLAAGILCLFWAAYHYLLIVYSARTPGSIVARLELKRFDGTSTSRSLRRWRVLASWLSAASLGMGYAWLFLDEDALCWHDRITHTYLAPRPPLKK